MGSAPCRTAESRYADIVAAGSGTRQRSTFGQPDVAGGRGIIVSVLPENVVVLSWQAVRLLCLLISMWNGCRVLSRFRLGTAALFVEIMPVGMGVEAALIDFAHRAVRPVSPSLQDGRPRKIPRRGRAKAGTADCAAVSG